MNKMRIDMSEYFTFYEADIIAEDLVSRCINNTISGRGCCEVIPYDYRTIDSDGFCGLGLSLHYDDKVGLISELHPVSDWDEDIPDDSMSKEDWDDMLQEHSDYIDEVKAWVDYYMERVSGIESLCEIVEKIQLSVEDAKDKTNWLFENGCISFD